MAISLSSSRLSFFSSSFSSHRYVGQLAFLSLFLCLFLVSFMQPLLCQESQPSQSWRYCPNFTPTVFKNVDVTISPTIPRPGEVLNIAINADVLETVVEPVLKLSVLFRGILPLTSNQHLCDTPESGCYVQPGRFTVNHPVFIPIFIKGKVEGKAEVKDLHERLIACINFGPLNITNIFL